MTNHRECYRRDNESNHQYSHRRDNEIEAALKSWGSLDIYQLRFLFFPTLQMARRRADILAGQKKVNRVRLSVDLPYFYFAGRRPAQIEHRIGVNYARLFLHRWEQITAWEYEPAYYEKVRPDGFCGTNDGFYFVEFDRGFDPFDKVEKYNALHQSGEYARGWWAKQAKRFPPVLVVTCDEARKRSIDKLVAHSAVEFRIYLYAKVREVVKNG